MILLKNLWAEIIAFFSDEENPDEPIYDPVHLAGMVVVVLFVIGGLFWLLWTLLVYGGGLFNKIGPAFSVLFTSKTLKDYGWVGYPFELGAFEGFVGNLCALFISAALIFGVWWLFKKGEKDDFQSQ